MAKDQTAELSRRLREAAQLQDPVAKAAIELVRLSIENVKESLVTADGEDMYRLQGTARYLSRMLRDLTVDPPAIMNSGDN